MRAMHPTEQLTTGYSSSTCDPTDVVVDWDTVTACDANALVVSKRVSWKQWFVNFLY